MLRNFRVGKSNEVVFEGRSYDLHNHYDFGGLAIERGRIARLWFTPNSEYGHGRRSIVLEVRGVDFLEISRGFGSRDLRDMEQVGYKNPADKDLDWLVSEANAVVEDHLVIQFPGDDYVRVHGESMTCSELP